MRQTQAKLLRRQVVGYAQKRGLPFKKSVYRQLKQLFNSTPRPLRAKFSL